MTQAIPHPAAEPVVAAAQPPAGAPRRRRLPDVLAALAGTALIGWQGARLGQWMVDDAAITFAYARSIDEGLGPVQQAGAPPVEGYSNPAWLALLLVGRRLGLFDHRAYAGVPDLVLYPKLLGLLCAFGILLCVGLAARGAVRHSWAVTALAGTLLAANVSFTAWMFSGLENPLYALAATALAAVLARAAVGGGLLHRGPAVAAGLLALAAALTRPDGAVLAAVHPLLLLLHVTRARLLPSLRAAALGAAVFLLPYAGFLAWRYATFGRLVPNTAVAKAQEPPTLELFAGTGALLAFAGWTAVLVCAGVTGAVLGRPGPARAALGAVLLPLALTLASFGVLKPDWMGLYRFATPVWALAACAVGVATVALLERGPARAGALTAVTVCGALLLAWGGQRERAAEFRAHPTLPMCVVVDRYGVTFNEYADRLGLKDASFLTPDLGGTLLTSDLVVQDLAGLTEPDLADAFAAGDMAALRAHVFGTLRPTLVHAHGYWATYPGLTPRRMAAEGYLPLYAESSRHGDGGDWVRADAVRDPGRLAATRAWARREVGRILRAQEAGRRGDCGEVLRPGQRLS
ncbi:hypothetical protein [Streptomyces sp. NPDC002564]|uniref:hypothetical protein n=1 Tax=Streptomyces sp. NPDC002564 TaxID=3364649 RepID=UPI00369002CD